MTNNRVRHWWKRLNQSWNMRLVEKFGSNPPEDWSDLIARCDDSRMEQALFKLQAETPVHPPTLGQLRAAIPQRHGNVASAPERLAEHVMQVKSLCEHQSSKPWTYFGERGEDGSSHGWISTKGVKVPKCDECNRTGVTVYIADVA